MATPFALKPNEAIEMWNGLLDQLEMPSDAGEGAPPDATSVLRLPIGSPESREQLNLLFTFIYKGFQT